MRICHVTPHLPPDQAANALLPFHLGWWARERGDDVEYIAHPPRATANRRRGAPRAPELAGSVAWIARRTPGSPLARALKVSGLIAALRIARAVRPIVDRADVVHVHSNGLLAEVAALVAARRRKPFVLTLYGTEIWHYRPTRLAPDLFTRAYRAAAHVTFYSQGLLNRAVDLGLARHDASVVYPPIAPEFDFSDSPTVADERRRLGFHNRHLLVNVKRLHPLAGQRFLIEALGEVVRTHPDTRLVICGTGPLLGELQNVARYAGVERHVTFAGLVDNETVARYDRAADAFILPSLLEACPTVAVEALACGTPVITADSPGGVELGHLFGVDVTVVAKENALALARAIVDLLNHKRRTLPATADVVAREFAPRRVAEEFWRIYEAAGAR